MRSFSIITVLVLGVLVAAAAGCSQEANTEGHQDHNHSPGDQPGAPHEGHAHKSSNKSGAPTQSASDPVLTAYLKIQKALAADSTSGIATAASALSKTAGAHQSHGGSHAEVATGLMQASSAFQGADLAAAREAFKTLSQRMMGYREIVPSVLSQTIVLHCSMANANWIQTTNEVANPYYGSSMASCGDVTKQRGSR
jgi:hypothetical protein